MNCSPKQFGYRNQISIRDAMREWLGPMYFTHLVTLTTNDQSFKRERMKDRLRNWDGRVNREIVGPKWLKRYDERINWIAFPEKAGVNPHWHLLLQLTSDQIRDLGASNDFNRIVKRTWSKLVPSGSSDVELIKASVADSTTVADYVTKSLGYEPNIEDFVIFREFFDT
ncbi:hypothetical protein J7399_10415 [Shimia sp. R9_1]|uniref:hypothetical protein n=1 Tax=unclassified Shimia TaxID=2630038 RepID=UPI001ADBEE6B|nr:MULTISPECIES: hypothetical protein [unclassified Shimia]MBO9399944.1 hypothetical protein [Shimia sp. R9_3]MBO9407843.1 hypothetical protein [Shimia sp. R9_1]